MAKVLLCVRPLSLCSVANTTTGRLFISRGASLRLRVPLSCNIGMKAQTRDITNSYYYHTFSFHRGLNSTNSMRRRNFRANHNVNELGSIDSPLINSMQTKIKEQLNAESVIVKDAYGDGRHVSIDVISSVFEGESAVSRQRMVYKAIWEELQNTVHAVDQMTTKTPSEAATNK